MPNVLLLAKQIRKRSKNMAWKTAVKQAAKQIKTKKVGAFKVIEKGENRSTPAKRVVQVVRSAKGQFRGYKKVSGVKKHLDNNSHNIRVRIGAAFKFDDPVAAREIALTADHEFKLYNNVKRPIILNLQRKYKIGQYNVEKAAKAFNRFVDAALIHYQKLFGTPGRKWYQQLSMNDRKLLAHEYAVELKKEMDSGNFID